MGQATGLIRHLLLLNGVAVIAAVVQHASGWGFTSLFWWTDRYRPVATPDFSQLGTLTYYALRVLEQASIFAPPAFLFVSGFFVAFAAGRSGAGLRWGTVRGRLKMLLIPYLLWSVAIFAGRGLEGATDSSAGYVQQLLFGRAAEPYYYIPLITQLYLLAPFLVSCVRKDWRLTLGVAAVLQVTVQAARYPVLLGWEPGAGAGITALAPGWFFPQLGFWFVAGIAAGTHLQHFRVWLDRWRAVLPGVTLALGCAAVVEWELLLAASRASWLPPAPTVVDSLFSGAVIMTFLAFAHGRIGFTRPLDALGERSFGVYLIHAPVLELLSRSVYHGVPVLLGHQFIFITILILAGLVVPLLAMAMINRTPARPYYNYLFG